MQAIKKEFMAYRNGVVADQLRKALDPNPYSVIFGLMIPQIAEISRGMEPSMALADQLWADKKVRESRLLACYLFPCENVDETKASELIESIQTQEEADMLAFRLLRRCTFAERLVEKYADADNNLQRYLSAMLYRHINR